MWFSFFHHEKGITSAIDRYRNEIKRVWGVIDRHLKKTGTEYLVGDKATYADLTFVPWDLLACKVTAEHVKVAEEFPTFYAWHEKLKARPAVQAMIKAKEAAAAK
jgi:glutathione S-transferase